MRVVGDLMDARMRLFQHVLAVELPVLLDTMKLGPAVRAALWDHARTLQNWLAGILNWHQGCHRYAEADLLGHALPAPPKPFRGPAGLGTSAARVTRAPGVTSVTRAPGASRPGAPGTVTGPRPAYAPGASPR
jgi:germacradienol/geosmin synthase